MAGTMDRPFLESVANCTTCLDLRKEHLRRQWRKFGRLPAVDAPYSITLKKLTESVRTTSCDGCAIILKACQTIKDEFDLDFSYATLRYMDDNSQQGLSLTLAMIHPLHTNPGDWDRAQEHPDLKTLIHTGPTSDRSSKRQWEHKITSPSYELFIPEQRKSTECRFKDEISVQVASATKPESWNSILRRPSRCADSGGTRAVKWALANLNKCYSSHEGCKNLGSSPLPTRVLDLGDRNQGESVQDVKLFVSHDEEEPYLCLSHCWGAVPALMPLKTTTENFQAFQQGISWERLTPTFQQAVTFTRMLGYRYLWIDSLCIIQDDIEDWMNEAGKMADIYENAVLTLAAASSSNSNDGLFRASTPHIDLGSDNICLRRFSDPTFFNYNPKGRRRDVDGVSPLLKRAWVFQERMLSRRILFFTPLELVFECRTSSCTESGYSWIDSEAKRAFTAVDSKKNANGEAATLWRNLVKDFTQLQLTMGRDTLPAMAGLARKFQQLRGVSNESYLAGLWRETFIQDMLWETPRHAERRYEAEDARIPTWSWARTREPKHYEIYRDLTQLSSLEDATCEFGGQSDALFTSVDSGHALLSGYLIKAKVANRGVFIDQNPRVSHNPLIDFDWFADGPRKVQNGDELFILPLASSPSGEGDAFIHTLVLRPCSGEENVFTRIGMFQPSIYHLRNHEYIFEGRDTLLSLYRRDVKYGESLVGKDGLYRNLDEGPKKPRVLSTKVDKEHKDFESRVMLSHLYLRGKTTEVELKDFRGRLHLDALSTVLKVEEERVRDWVHRDEHPEAQPQKRVLIKII